jgi:preprotein translocase subunit SecG
MKKIYSLLVLAVLVLIPRWAGADMMGFGSDEYADGIFHMGSNWGWLMMLTWIVWLGVGILLFIWLLKKILK